MDFYQHIPFFINPTAFSFGKLPVDWYSLMYLVAFLIVYFLLKLRIKKGELPKELGKMKDETLLDFLLVIFLGLLIGARFGYAIFYNPVFYWQNPLAIISPFDALTGEFVGFYGMSYHGGLIGSLLAGWIFVRKRGINFWALADFIVPAIPAGYFFGRLGNFLNGELFGRATEKFWGMFFPGDVLGLLRHPSQLYEALAEGLAIFILLWFLRNRFNQKGFLTGLYLVSYAFFRFVLEFFREPDAHIRYVLAFFTLGQMFSLGMFFAGMILIFSKVKRVV